MEWLAFVHIRHETNTDEGEVYMFVNLELEVK